MEQRASDPQVRDIEVDGQRLHVAVQGSTSRTSVYPFLFMNGIGASLELLQPFVDALGSGIETIRFDVLGAGQSPAPERPYRLKGLARLTAHLLDRMGYAEVDVLGVSWGGGLAQEFAHHYPDRCRRLVLASTSAGSVMIPGRLSVLARMADLRRYRDPGYMAAIIMSRRRPSSLEGQIRGRRLLRAFVAPDATAGPVGRVGGDCAVPDGRRGKAPHPHRSRRSREDPTGARGE